MPQLDVTTFSSQIFWLVVTFVALFLIMWRVSVPKISDALEARQKRIDDNLARAQELKKEAEAALDAYDTSLAGARSEAQNTLLQANVKLAEEAQAREAELGETLTKRIAESEANIATAMNTAIANIHDVAIEVSASAAQRLTGEVPSVDAASTAVEATIKARR